jgi:hypothetical protein
MITLETASAAYEVDEDKHLICCLPKEPPEGFAPTWDPYLIITPDGDSIQIRWDEDSSTTTEEIVTAVKGPMSWRKS